MHVVEFTLRQSWHYGPALGNNPDRLHLAHVNSHMPACDSSLGLINLKQGQQFCASEHRRNYKYPIRRSGSVNRYPQWYSIPIKTFRWIGPQLFRAILSGVLLFSPNPEGTADGYCSLPLFPIGKPFYCDYKSQ